MSSVLSRYVRNWLTVTTRYFKTSSKQKSCRVNCQLLLNVHKFQKSPLSTLTSAEDSFIHMDVKDAVVKHLNTPEFRSIFSPGLKQLQQIFAKYNFELRLCGGAVRDILLGNEPQDLDFATVATPHQMISMFNDEGIRLINETGWGHGTVTCRMEEENFEITTLRIDTVTDGRRATVAYTTDWKIDASRRDLTVNSMFMTLDGFVIDYCNGMQDLENREIRFVGDPKTRIMEDYLRILRYFRFFGRIADDDTKFDERSIDVISNNFQGLRNVSGERIHIEMERIFTGNYVVKILRKMHECGLFPIIGLPHDADLDEFERVYQSIKCLNPHYMTYVTALLSTENDLDVYHARVKFSRLHVNIARFIIKHRGILVEPANLHAWYIDVLVEYHRLLGIKHKGGINYFLEFLKYRGDAHALEYFENFTVPKFPVRGNEIKDKTGAKGKNVGLVIKMLYQLWKESRYAATAQELLEHVDETTVDKLKNNMVST